MSSRLGATALATALVLGSGVAGARSADPDRPRSADTSPTAAPSPSPTGSAVENAELATVRLSSPCDEEDACPFGSGTVVDSTGLILTNAHVAAPASPGLGGQYDDLQDDVTNPPYLIVSVPPSVDADAVPLYRATVVAVDGYADLAVLQVTADLKGKPLDLVPPMRNLPLGALAEVKKTAAIWVLGYPSSGGSLSATIHPGSVASKPVDPDERVTGPWELNTGAEIHAGNSGGAVIDTAGRLIAIPTYSLGYRDVTYRARAVELARPLIEAGKYGRTYVSPYLVPATGAEKVASVAWGDRDVRCGAAPLDAPLQVTDYLAAQVRLEGMAAGEDYRLELLGPGGVVFTTTQDAWDGSGCAGIGYAAFDDVLPSGEYTVRVRVGPRSTLVGSASTTVTATAVEEEYTG